MRVLIFIYCWHMNDRQKDILAFVINEYIKSAQPVGSALLSEKADFGLSSATYRNELATLETDGYLMQPHTSSGRVPTEKAYKLYADEYLNRLKFIDKPERSLKLQFKDEMSSNEMLKEVAKQLVAKSDEAVIVSFDKESLYYTGLSNLFAKPEFADQKDIVNVSSTMDHLEGIIGKVLEQVKDVEVLIGSNNPFGSQCATVIGKYHLKNGQEGMFAVLGPMRMDYEKNIGLVQNVRLLLEGGE